MILSDAIKMEGPQGVCPWGFNVSISGISSCGCTTDVSQGGIGYGIGSGNLVKLADFSAIPTLPIDGRCFNASNGAVWLPDQHGTRCLYAYCDYVLQDAYTWFAGISSNSAMAVVELYGNLNNDCLGTPNTTPCAMLGSVYYTSAPVYLAGPNPSSADPLLWVFIQADVAGVGLCPIFQGSGFANCVFSNNPPTVTIPNQLVCGTRNQTGYVIASGGQATLTPVSVGRRVPWSCGVAYQPPFIVYDTGRGGCPSPDDVEGNIRAVPCFGQCMGTNEGSFRLAAGTASAGLSGWRQITHGAVGIAKALIGLGGADKEMVEKRGAICHACPHAVIVAGVFNTCEICSCQIWSKIRNVGEHCPIQKW